MNRWTYRLAFVLTAALLGPGVLYAWVAGERKQFEARIIHVDDGDTVVAMTGIGQKTTIRLASIDAPETSKNRCKPGQPFSQKAKDALSAMVLGRTLSLVCYDVDRWDRSVCDIALENTTASRMLVSKGLAWANTASQRYLRDPLVSDLQSQAQLTHVGLWSVQDSVAPWEWRRTVWVNTCPSAKNLLQ